MTTVVYPTDTKTLESIQSEISAHAVELLHLQFIDIEGIMKHVTVTSAQVEDVVSGKIMFDGSSIKGFSPINKSDLYLQPDLSTFCVMPWTKTEEYSEARFICSVKNPDGTDFAGDPRNVLKKTVKRAADKGFSISVGPELEFFLFETDAAGRPTQTTQDFGGYFEPSPHDFGEKVRTDIYKTLKQMGFIIEASHHEVAIGQHEINFKYADALGAADLSTTFKWVVKTVARKHGLHASFMPKPIAGENGSGMHTNISLFDIEKQENAFFDETDKKQLSPLAYQFIAGMIDNVKNFVAVTNPLVNSYKRLVPGYEAPCYIAWSDSNRSALIRIPATRGAGTRVEIRCPDPSANPYLAFAVVAASGLDGIDRQLEVVDPVDADIFAMDAAELKERQIDNLPSSLEAAINAFEEGDFGRNTLGDHVFEEYVAAKRNEWDSFRTAVTGWEIEQYQTKF
ncbi:type I glutamate--ammonia ligase [Aureibacillus halotolerans]|uniref:Glutamine synthetase n=1 Tax=Aureibacillus halotolerans TaxID=1508390 RepID=A0A4R6UAC4_9BACI|nr:type I glutamate--ammonia ligase [Aureibacillus halotolerans]TDQ42796.1 L-glutamine synthetase [Aureibacillus halotolerans]